MSDKIEKMATEVCTEFGLALYDLEIKTASKGKIIVVYLTKIGGVTIAECQKVSKRLNFLLDEADFVEGRYFLEVSSPGLERELKMKKHFKSAINENVKITYSDTETSKTITGKLLEVSPDEIVVETLSETISIKMKRIKKAKTYFEFKSKKERR